MSKHPPPPAKGITRVLRTHHPRHPPKRIVVCSHFHLQSTTNVNKPPQPPCCNLNLNLYHFLKNITFVSNVTMCTINRRILIILFANSSERYQPTPAPCYNLHRQPKKIILFAISNERYHPPTPRVTICVIHRRTSSSVPMLQFTPSTKENHFC